MDEDFVLHGLVVVGQFLRFADIRISGFYCCLLTDDKFLGNLIFKFVSWYSSSCVVITTVLRTSIYSNLRKFDGIWNEACVNYFLSEQQNQYAILLVIWL